MDISRKGAFEFGTALFHQNNDIDRFQILIGKSFALLRFDTVILTHDKVGSITIAALPRKMIADLLHFNVNDLAISCFDNDIHHNKSTGVR